MALLEALGFSTAMFGFALMSFNILLVGLLITIVGDAILVLYGILTQQYWLAGANVMYIIIAIAGAVKQIYGSRT